MSELYCSPHEGEDAPLIRRVEATLPFGHAVAVDEAGVLIKVLGCQIEPISFLLSA